MPTAARKSVAQAAALLPPVDARLMNGIAAAAVTLVLLVLAWQGLRWVTRSPLFTVEVIQLEASLEKASLGGLRSIALPRVAGNFFALDLDAARAAFEQVPWVRRAVVRRVWPNRLAVSLEEHEAAAVWQGEGSGRRGERLVNRHGELFSASAREVAQQQQALPTLAGADAQSAQMLAMLQRLNGALEPTEHKVELLRLSPRGSWQAELSGGAKLELGRGSDDEVVMRVERLARTLASVNARFGSTPRALVAADLRHPDGYALRLAGITTAATTNGNNRP